MEIFHRIYKPGNYFLPEKGYKGEDVYSISGGNPFYVNEILASYSTGVPDNIKDAVLSVYNRLPGNTKEIWDIMSVLPTGLEAKYLEKIAPQYEAAIEYCLNMRILVMNDDVFLFKHELYRRTIEESLSPFKRIAHHKKILELLRNSFEETNQTERIIHHAKNANDYDTVLHYAPIGAKQAAMVGAHTQAARLYYTALEYYQGSDKELLLQFYEAYAYECYLTNQIKEAIIYQGKALGIWKAKNDKEKIGNCLRFLSRLWWFEGDRKQATKFAAEAIEILEDQPPSKIKAMAFSNMSQLNMLSDEVESCLYWGEKAVALSREVNDEEIVSHALNNMGSILTHKQAEKEKGLEMLQHGLDIALRNGYHEHVARAYTNLGSNLVVVKDYSNAEKMLAKGIQYCEERDLYAWTKYMLTWRAKLKLETRNWKAASDIALQLLENDYQPGVVKIGALTVLAIVLMRNGNPATLPLLQEAKKIAFVMNEYQRIIPVMIALLEYEWLTGTSLIEETELQLAISMAENTDNIYQNSEFSFWLMKTRKLQLPLQQLFTGYDTSNEKARHNAILFWESLDCPFEKALLLFDGNDEDKRKAITIIQEFEAGAVLEKMKQLMRGSGIKKIPRGIRESTRLNPAQLTNREIDILQLLQQSMQNKEIASALFISAKTVDHHISSILFKLDVNSRAKAVQEAQKLKILK